MLECGFVLNWALLPKVNIKKNKKQKQNSAICNILTKNFAVASAATIIIMIYYGD